MRLVNPASTARPGVRWTRPGRLRAWGRALDYRFFGHVGPSVDSCVFARCLAGPTNGSTFNRRALQASNETDRSAWERGALGRDSRIEPAPGARFFQARP